MGHQPNDVPGYNVAVVPWYVIDVCMTVIQACVMTVILSSMRTTTLQPIRLFIRLMCNGTERVEDCGAGVMVCVLYGERE